MMVRILWFFQLLFFLTHCFRTAHSAILDKVVWSGEVEWIQIDLNPMETGFLMVSDVLNGTGHPTFQKFSPLASISSSFLEELSFCALAASSIFALWMFSACFCCVGCLCTCALRLRSAQWASACSPLFGCMPAFECAGAEDAARFWALLAEHRKLVTDNVATVKCHQAEHMMAAGLLGWVWNTQGRGNKGQPEKQQRVP